MTRIIGLSALWTAVTLGAACTMKSQEAPPLAGPSELGTSITVSVSPDVLTQDGASQSLVTITARDSNGAPLRNLSLRAEISVGGVRADFGTISARNLVTDSAGHASLVYTAPTVGTGPAVDSGTIVDIMVTPIGTDFGNATARLASIRLVPPGIIVPPDGLQPKFTVTPESPSDHQAVFFDASTSTAPANNPIASYAWQFGDGGTASGMTATHSYGSSGTFVATLTISDGLGRSASTTKSIAVGQGTGPTVSVTFSPAAPIVGQSVNFNASASRPAPGRTIQSYYWDFGDGEQKTTSTALTTHDFLAGGTYLVTIVATDDAGHTGNTTVQVIVTSDAPTANITMSPTDPVAGDTVIFSGAASVPATGHTIVSYRWDFGDPAAPAPASGVQATHAFSVARTYSVTLTVTDDIGRTGSTTKLVTIK